jgi:hypothetical protein
VLQARGGVTPDESAELWLSLARALRALGEDPPRVRALAERARATWQAEGPTTARRRARAEAFLRELDASAVAAERRDRAGQ